ncbi:receptor-like protein 9a [Gastrolobium bilobum]|uniref:receptor-like protein 9a n=1 Tax=Gastrolobium bilobum TaxID=150636 RepID=UPI002AB296BB|nr:receptor-like protein 9a [Gastrolobium bilobum]
MRLAFVLNSLFYFVALLIQNQMCNGCIEKEKMGLLQIKAYIVAHDGQYANYELESWVEDRDSNCCDWDRVRCSTGHVTHLDLSNLYASVMLNVSIFGPFEELHSLDFSYNRCEGWIANEGLPILKKLETLDLSGNSLNNSILPSLNGLPLLRTLNLRSNKIDDFKDLVSFEGFPRLNKLKTLDLSGNWLNNSNLPSLNGLPLLRSLKLRYNSFSCLLATDFANFSQLELLDLSFNHMEGSIDGRGLQKLGNLKVLDLSGNYLNGICKMKDLVELDLSSNKFSGPISGCLSILRNLQVLDLSHNMFSCNFPSFTSNLTSLVYLSFLDNYLQGSFLLSTLANHSNLQVLYINSLSPGAHVETEKTQWVPTFQLKSLILQSCKLNMDKGRTIPSFLLYQKDLQSIDLSHNKLVGAFPSWLIQNKNLSILDISNNNINGFLPKNIGTFLPEIKMLNMSKNNFEGNIPASIGKMQQISFLDLSDNSFSGELPEQLATNWTNLETLKLSNNFLQGNIPRFSNLYELYLNNNKLYGTLKEVLENLNSGELALLDISNNSISGEIPASIGKFSSLGILLMAKNQLEGEIPFEFSNLTYLFMLDLSQNRILGSISSMNLSYMRYLYLQKNAFSGSIPFTFSEGPKLVTLDLRDNNFSGSIPYWMDKLSNLRVLLLGGNNFHGHIPIQLCQLNGITIMDLSLNKLNGSIPSCFNNLSFGMLETYNHDPIFEFPWPTSALEGTTFFDSRNFLNVSVSLYKVYPQNMLSGEMVSFYEVIATIVEFRTKSNYYSYGGNILENMTGLDLSCNMLSGIIPSQIGNMQQIHALNLSHNYLLGSIPNTFSNLTQIESLDLSYNNLCGEIPSQLTQLNFLSILNVSYNNLSGTPPSTGQFGDFDEDNYRGNPGLCGPLLKQKCEGVATPPSSESNNTVAKETTVDMEAFYWSFCASYITILLGFIMVLYINAYWRMALFYYMETESVDQVMPQLEAVDTHLRRTFTVSRPPKRYKFMIENQQTVEDNEPTSYTEVFKRKTDVDGNIQTYKARLVAKGYHQRQGINFEETFSPVAKIKSIRIILAIVAYYDYEVWQMDVNTAFLNGFLKEKVYMTQPEEYKAASEATKEAVWNKKFVIELGVVPSIVDPIPMYCDNTGAITQGKEPSSHQRSKHVLHKYHLIQEIVERLEIKMDYVPTDDNFPDSLTKCLS